MRLLALLAVGVFVGAVLSAPVPRALKKSSSLPDGHWLLMELTDDGRPLGPINGLTRHALIEGEAIGWAKEGRPKVPAANFTALSPDRPGLRMLEGKPAAFEVEGDTLRLCYAYDGRAELTECKPGKGIYYYVFERVKDELKEPKKDK